MKRLILQLCTLTTLSIAIFVGVTNAVMNDIEISGENEFSATSLDAELRNGSGTVHDGVLFMQDRVTREEVLTQEVEVHNSGELDFEYFLGFEFVQGEIGACEVIELSVEREGEKIFDGPVTELNTATQAAVLASGAVENLEFSISHDTGDVDLQGQECDFDIDVTAYEDVSNQIGFYDVETLSSNLKIAYEANLSAEYDEDLDTFTFVVGDLHHFQSFTYSLEYLKDGGNDLVIGVEDVNDETVNVDIYLGTCSDVCTPYVNPHDFELLVNLLDIDGYVSSLSAQL